MGGLDGEEGEEGVGNVLDGMMRQLMTREILMEPLEELADKVGRLGVVVPDEENFSEADTTGNMRPGWTL